MRQGKLDNGDKVNLTMETRQYRQWRLGNLDNGDKVKVTIETR